MAKISKYNYSLIKRILDLLFPLLILLLLLPISITVVLIECFFRGLIIFQQERVGKGTREFTIYKFRTMKLNSEKIQKKYLFLNKADGPVFKIKKIISN